MPRFYIDEDRNITHLRDGEQPPEGAHEFQSEAELAKLAEGWPMTSLVELWNSFAGAPPFGELRPVKKFENRRIACQRVWAAIQRLAGAEAEMPPVAETQVISQSQEDTTMKKKTARKERAPKPKREIGAARDGSKKAEIIEMLKRKSGASLEEIMKHTKWLPHTTRAFVSILGSKAGFKIARERDPERGRVYRIAG